MPQVGDFDSERLQSFIHRPLGKKQLSDIQLRENCEYLLANRKTGFLKAFEEEDKDRIVGISVCVPSDQEKAHGAPFLSAFKTGVCVKSNTLENGLGIYFDGTILYQLDATRQNCIRHLHGSVYPMAEGLTVISFIDLFVTKDNWQVCKLISKGEDKDIEVDNKDLNSVSPVVNIVDVQVADLYNLLYGIVSEGSHIAPDPSSKLYRDILDTMETIILHSFDTLLSNAGLNMRLCILLQAIETRYEDSCVLGMLDSIGHYQCEFVSNNELLCGDYQLVECTGLLYEKLSHLSKKNRYD